MAGISMKTAMLTLLACLFAAAAHAVNTRLGHHYLFASGTPEKPIVIKGAPCL